MNGILQRAGACALLLLLVVVPLGCDTGGEPDESGIASPRMVLPLDGSTNNPNAVVLEWLVPKGGARYDVEVARDPTFENVVARETGTTVSAFTVKDLELGVPYYWRVRAHDVADLVSSWSPTWVFTPSTTAIVPPIPFQKYPAPETVDMPTNVELKWEPSKGALSYDIEMSMQPDMDRKVADLRVRGTEQDIHALVQGYTYYWRVRANSAIGSSGWSPIWKFVCAL